MDDAGDGRESAAFAECNVDESGMDDESIVVARALSTGGSVLTGLPEAERVVEIDSDD